MISDRAVAEQISQVLLDVGRQLNASVSLVQGTCSADELSVYRRAVGQVMGAMLLDIMNPLYARHPHLKPKEMR